MANNRTDAIVAASVFGGIFGVMGYIAHKAFKSSKEQKEYERKMKDKQLEIEEKRAQRNHELEMERLKGMSPEQKYKIRQDELDVRRLEAEAKNKVASMKSDVISEVTNSVKQELHSIAHDEVCDIFKGFNKASDEQTRNFNITLS